MNTSIELLEKYKLEKHDFGLFPVTWSLFFVINNSEGNTITINGGVRIFSRFLNASQDYLLSLLVFKSTYGFFFAVCSISTPSSVLHTILIIMILAAITIYPKLGSLNNTLFSHSFGNWESKIKFWKLVAKWGFSEASFLGFQTVILFLLFRWYFLCTYIPLVYLPLLRILVILNQCITIITSF